MKAWGPRARILVDDHFPIFVALAVVVTLVGGAVVYATYVDPGTETVSETQAAWETTGGYSHQSTVTEDTQVFDAGETLEDRSTYYTRINPELEGTFEYGFQAPGGEFDVDVETHLLLTGVGGDDEDEEELWRVEESLGEDGGTIGPGETVTVPFTLNVTEVREDVDDIESELGSGAGEVEVAVVTNVTADGTVDGTSVQNQETYDLGVAPDGDTYGVTAEDGSDRHESAEEVTRPAEPGTLQSLAGPLLVIVGLAGLTGLTVGRRQDRFDVSPTERERLGFASERSEFDDWISRGSLADDRSDRPTVEIDSLEDLVDVAIDTDERVIEDVEERRYLVLSDGHRYTYEPPQSVDVESLAE